MAEQFEKFHAETASQVHIREKNTTSHINDFGYRENNRTFLEHNAIFCIKNRLAPNGSASI